VSPGTEGARTLGAGRGGKDKDKDKDEDEDEDEDEDSDGMPAGVSPDDPSSESVLVTIGWGGVDGGDEMTVTLLDWPERGLSQAQRAMLEQPSEDPLRPDLSLFGAWPTGGYGESSGGGAGAWGGGAWDAGSGGGAIKIETARERRERMREDVAAGAAASAAPGDGTEGGVSGARRVAVDEDALMRRQELGGTGSRSRDKEKEEDSRRKLREEQARKDAAMEGAEEEVPDGVDGSLW